MAAASSSSDSGAAIAFIDIGAVEISANMPRLAEGEHEVEDGIAIASSIGGFVWEEILSSMQRVIELVADGQNEG